MEKIKPFEQEYPLSSFIGAYYIDQRICDKILQYCEDNEHLKKETELKNKGEYSEYETKIKNDEIDNKIKLFKEYIQEKLQETICYTSLGFNIPVN